MGLMGTDRAGWFADGEPLCRLCMNLISTRLLAAGLRIFTHPLRQTGNTCR